MPTTQPKFPLLPAYIYGKETSPNERVYTDAAIVRHANAAMNFERSAIAAELSSAALALVAGKRTNQVDRHTSEVLERKAQGILARVTPMAMPAEFTSAETLTDALAQLRNPDLSVAAAEALILSAAAGLWESKIAAALATERERLCTLIKAEDDRGLTESNYMLDANDVVAIIRGNWMAVS